jgi:hypothetical protein
MYPYWHGVTAGYLYGRHPALQKRGAVAPALSAACPDAEIGVEATAGRLSVGRDRRARRRVHRAFVKSVLRPPFRIILFDLGDR